MTPTRRLVKLSPILVVAALALPGSAFGQATRTWVSGVGDDANPCSRTAPCKTFAGAISKTATRGEINCLDPGGFGGVTINKALTIKCHYTEGGVLVSGTNAIVVNAPTTDRVTLRGLDINGIGTGLNGIRILSAKSVDILDSEISEFTGAGIDVNPTVNMSVYITRNHIHDVGVGVMNAPGSNTLSFTTAVLRNNDIVNNTCGVVSSSLGQNATTPNANTDCGSATLASGINKIAATHVYHSQVSLNTNTGLWSRGSNSFAEIGWSEITNNAAFGLHRVDSGTIKTTSPASNIISGNTASDPPNGTVTMTKRQAKRFKHNRAKHKRYL